MARKERVRGARSGDRLEVLLDAGDHAAARAEARRVLADAATGGETRARASEALRSIAPERAAGVMGAIALVTAVAVGAWLLGH